MDSEPIEQAGAGDPDNFQRLWTPHRMAYIKGENKPTGSGKDDGCPFCEIPKLSDEDGLIIARAPPFSPCSTSIRTTPAT